jgi:hypothetical protein
MPFNKAAARGSLVGDVRWHLDLGDLDRRLVCLFNEIGVVLGPVELILIVHLIPILALILLDAVTEIIGGIDLISFAFGLIGINSVAGPVWPLLFTAHQCGGWRFVPFTDQLIGRFVVSATALLPTRDLAIEKILVLARCVFRPLGAPSNDFRFVIPDEGAKLRKGREAVDRAGNQLVPSSAVPAGLLPTRS